MAFPNTPPFLPPLCALSLLSPLAAWGQVDLCKYHIGFFPVEINGRYYYYDTREVEEKTLVTYPNTHQEKEYACTIPVTTSKTTGATREFNVFYRCGPLSLKNRLVYFRDSENYISDPALPLEAQGWKYSSLHSAFLLIDTKGKEWKLRAPPIDHSNNKDYVCDDSGRRTMEWSYYQVLDEAYSDAGTLRIITRTTQKLLGIKDKQKPSF